MIYSATSNIERGSKSQSAVIDQIRCACRGACTDSRCGCRKAKKSVTVDVTKLALVVRIIEVCNVNQYINIVNILHKTVKYCMLGSVTHNPIDF